MEGMANKTNLEHFVNGLALGIPHCTKLGAGETTDSCTGEIACDLLRRRGLASNGGEGERDRERTYETQCGSCCGPGPCPEREVPVDLLQSTILGAKGEVNSRRGKKKEAR